MPCIDSAIAGIRIEATDIPIVPYIDSVIAGMRIESTLIYQSCHVLILL